MFSQMYTLSHFWESITTPFSQRLCKDVFGKRIKRGGQSLWMGDFMCMWRTANCKLWWYKIQNGLHSYNAVLVFWRLRALYGTSRRSLIHTHSHKNGRAIWSSLGLSILSGGAGNRTTVPSDKWTTRSTSWATGYDLFWFIYLYVIWY